MTFGVGGIGAIGGMSDSKNMTSVASAWTPDLLDNMVLWYNPEAETSFSEGDPVDVIADQSGNGWACSAAGGDRPTYKDAYRNGRAVLDFERTDANEMVTAGNVTHGIGGGNFTWAVVVNSEANANYTAIIANGAFAPSFYFRGTPNALDMYWGADNDFTTQPADGTWYIILIVRSGNDLNAYINGATDGTTVDVTARTMANAVFRLGGSGANEEWDGQIGEVVFYSDAVTSDERDLLNTYFSNKFNISI